MKHEILHKRNKYVDFFRWKNKNLFPEDFFRTIVKKETLKIKIFNWNMLKSIFFYSLKSVMKITQLKFFDNRQK